MFKQVVDIAWDNMTFIDGMILAIGFIALVLIVILAGIRRQHGKTIRKEKCWKYVCILALFIVA